jgi:hypothetical protein
MRAYWSARPMTLQEATYYERNAHARHSTFLDREFRCLLAVEQHICAQYAARLGYSVPRFHNDISPPVMDSFRRFIAERAIILDPWLIGLETPKYGWALQSRFQSLNCVGHVDWYYALSERHPGSFTDKGMLRQGKARAAKKRRLGVLARLSAPFGGWVYSRPAKLIINRVLRFL